MLARSLKSKFDFTEEKYKSPLSVLLHSRTAIEKSNFISTGIITYIEGDLIEVEIPEYKLFELGDPVKLTVYSPGGIFSFESTVVAKDSGAVMIINPPANQKRFAEKRELARVEVSNVAVIRSALEGWSSEEKAAFNDVHVEVKNLSLGGIGFFAPAHFSAGKGKVVEMGLDLGFALDCSIEIVRFEKAEDSLFVGARYKQIVPEKLNSLRAFVLRKQVEAHFRSKNNANNKRVFK